MNMLHTAGSPRDVAPEYFDDAAPGSGRRAARADFLSDARRLSLNGDWDFVLSPTSAGTGQELLNGNAGGPGWGTIPVPSHWVLEGHGTPLYTNTAFPIPIDPPRVPADNPTGDYRRRFVLPDAWETEGTVLRFQGVDSCAKVWLNGHELGHSKGSRLPFEFDAGHLLKPGENLLCVRVHRWSSGTYLEDQDMWWLPGIFRDVELLERPAGGIDDFFVHAGFDHLTRNGTLRIDADVPGLVDIPELGISGLPTGHGITLAVEPWTAETPRLYRGTLRAAAPVTGTRSIADVGPATSGVAAAAAIPADERIDLAVGFRTVSIDDGRLLVNGSPVLFRGVNRHEHDPDVGRALPVEVMRQDLVMMKQHNINAVRTSHYPPHPAFLRLCDELGMWVVDECDIETHGFIYTGWEGNPPADPQWTPALLDRIERMVERDKNHPSVVVWSLANESWTGDAFTVIEDWVRQRDPGRPLHYERDPSYKNSDFYSLMYPSQEALEAIGRREEPTPAGVAEGSADDERRRGLPFLLCEYAHAMGNGPGSLADYQDILESHERFCGAFVWEWIDHGIRATDSGGNVYFQHGGDIDYRPNGGTYCLDGLVFPDRTPSPGLVEYKKVIEPVRITVDGGTVRAGGTIRIRNKRDFRDLSDLEFRWTLETDGRKVAEGPLPVPPAAARSTVGVPFPEFPLVAGGESWLTIRAVLAKDQEWAEAGHEVAWAQGMVGSTQGGSAPQAGAAVVGAETTRGREGPAGSALTLGPAGFDPATGRMTHWGDAVVDGPRLDVWRAPTENDRGQGKLNNLVLGWQALGLDRMLHVTESVELISATVLQVHSRVAPAGQGIALRTTYRWELMADGGLRLDVGVEPQGVWADTPVGNHTVTLPRLGLRMSLPGEVREVSWFGLGPGENYRDSLDAARAGLHFSSVDGLQTHYVVPQENGNRTGTRWLEFPGVLRVVGVLRDAGVDAKGHFDFSARRWTSEELQAANHPHELRDSGRVWVNLDLMQHGLGSSSCGPATPERYTVPVEPARFSLVFSAPTS